MRSPLKGKTTLVISLSVFLALCTFAYFLDSRASGTARVYEFRLPPSGKYNPSEGAVSGVYPVSGYDIDIGDLKAVNQFTSKLKLSNFAFLRIDNDQPNTEDRKISDFRLRFYFASLSGEQKPRHIVDTVVSVVADTPIEYRDLDLENRPAKEFVWTASEHSAALYPFDRYVLSLKTEEQVDISSAVTNTPPELFNVRLTNPRFIASDYVRPSSGGLDVGFVILRRPWLLRILAVCLLIVSLVFVFYLLTLKTAKEFLPGTLGYVAGVWGMRNIISSDAPMFPTITDYISLVLLGVVAVLIVAKLVFLKQQTEPNSAAEQKG